MQATENTVHNNKRIVTVDALRGFALLGIIYAHYVYWHSGGALPPFIYQTNYGIGSSIAVGINDILIFGKFFAFFSFLFGLSFYLQMKSLRSNGQSFVMRYAWRLTILLAIALLHQTFWMGDILIIYVPLGFVLLLVRHFSNRFLFITALLLILNVPVKIWEAVNFLFIHWEQASVFGKNAAAYKDIIDHGTLPQLWRFNWATFSEKANMQLFSGRLFITLGYFILGMYAGRQQWFENPGEFRPLVRRIFMRTWQAGLACFIIAGCIIGANEIFKLGWQENPVIGYVFGIIYDGFNAALVLFYISGLTLLMYKPRWQRIFYPLAPVGQMALSSYLSQTVVGLTLYFGFGFGLFLKTTPGWNFGIATLVFILQALFARWWFRHFRYGPVEWLWRSGTKLQWQPLRKTDTAPALHVAL